jgi:glucoamylase
MIQLMTRLPGLFGLVCLVFNGALCLAVSSQAQAQNVGDIGSWLKHQYAYSQTALLRNIGPTDLVPNAAAGAVVASPSFDPDYRYFWVRDAALVMDTVVSLYQSSLAEKQDAMLRRLVDYVDFSRRIQLTPNPSGGPDDLGLGEPKFEVDGRAFQGPWGRPQNDGPALRALTLTRLALLLIDQGQTAWVRSTLYDGRVPTHSVIKADLEFVAHHWRDSSFDLWEEVRGDHFYTRLVQRRALVEGAALAERLGDAGAEGFYRAQVNELEGALERHWDPTRRNLQVTLSRTAGLDYKDSGLDVAIVLGALHADSPASNGGQGSYFGPADDRVLATADQLSEAFHSIYPVNQVERDGAGQALGFAIGRYPEDTFSGTVWQHQGNPWFLATHALAELLYRASNRFEAQGQIQVTDNNINLFRRLRSFNRLAVEPGETIRSTDARFFGLLRGLRQAGDEYLRRSHFHSDPNGPMSEQFNRDTGFMQSATELTWSHASVLTVRWARDNAPAAESRPLISIR